MEKQSGPGEMGKPVILPTNMTADMKKLVDSGWEHNAFNQYAADLISVHRSLPDPRDQWYVISLFFFLFHCYVMNLSLCVMVL